MSLRSGQCSICVKDYKKLSEHIVNVHVEKEVSCDVCNKVFKSVMLKTKHVINTHGGDTSCETCDSRFPSKSYLLTHIRKIHSNDHNENIFLCSFCEKPFKSKQMLKLHELKSCKIKLNLTFKCDKICTGKAALMRHMEVHKEKIDFKTGNVKDECQVWKILTLLWEEQVTS